MLIPDIRSNASIKSSEKELKISLAQWSLHRAFNAGKMDPEDFASISKENFGINAIELVNQFYVDKVKDEKFWNQMKNQADDIGVRSLLIMVDDEGELGNADRSARIHAVENHYKWVNAAKLLDCHSIRVNAFGDKDEVTFQKSLTDGISRLAEYAGKEGINIIIENHGLFSSNAKMMTEVVKAVNKKNVGTFPDFGNWCLSAKWGSTQIKCDEQYDIYDGVSEMLPYAKAVSAKSYNFNEQGDHDKIDYYQLLGLVKASSYDGYIGIEYEGSNLSEMEGIKATKALMEKVWSSLD